MTMIRILLLVIILVAAVYTYEKSGGADYGISRMVDKMGSGVMAAFAGGYGIATGVASGVAGNLRGLGD